MKIFVGNLSSEVSEHDLRELFAEHGELKSVSLISDRATGVSRGFGFVEMADDDARAAIEALHETEYKGQNLTVNQARDRDKPKGFSGNGGFSRNDRGGGRNSRNGKSKRRKPRGGY